VAERRGHYGLLEESSATVLPALILYNTYLNHEERAISAGENQAVEGKVLTDWSIPYGYLPGSSTLFVYLQCDASCQKRY